MTDAQAVAWHVSGEGFDGDEFFTLSRRIGEHFHGAPLYPASVVEALRAEIAALRAGSQVPEGWKLVPIEPTDEMLANVRKEQVRQRDFDQAVAGYVLGFTDYEIYKACSPPAPREEPMTKPELPPLPEGVPDGYVGDYFAHHMRDYGLACYLAGDRNGLLKAKAICTECQGRGWDLAGVISLLAKDAQ